MSEQPRWPLATPALSTLLVCYRADDRESVKHLATLFPGCHGGRLRTSHLQSFFFAKGRARLHAQPPARGVQEFYGGAVRDGEDAPAEAVEAPAAVAEAAEAPAAGSEAPAEDAEAPVAAAEAPAEVAEAPAAAEEDAPGVA